MIPVLGGDSERSTELTGVLSPSAGGGWSEDWGTWVKTSKWWWKQHTDSEKASLPSHGRPELACKPLAQTDRRGYSGARSVPWHREDGQSVLCISFQGRVHLCLTHCLVAQDGGQEGPASVIQFYEYEKADHAFKTGSRSPSSTKMVEVVIRQGQRLSSVF